LEKRRFTIFERIANRVIQPEEMKMSKIQQNTSPEAKLLPLIELNGTEFLVDIERRQFRNTKNVNDIIEMHSQQGRQMVKSMPRTDWRIFALDSCPPDAEV
jgi:hypothetical protein